MANPGIASLGLRGNPGGASKGALMAAARQLGRELVEGPPCFRKDHGISRVNPNTWRCAATGACMRCVNGLSYGDLVVNARQLAPDARPRFFEWILLLDEGFGPLAPDHCWGWRGRVTHGSPVFPWYRTGVATPGMATAARVGFWFLRADLGMCDVYRTCGNKSCVNPLHLRLRGPWPRLPDLGLPLTAAHMAVNRTDAIAWLRQLEADEPARFRRLVERTPRILEHRRKSLLA